MNRLTWAGDATLVVAVAIGVVLEWIVPRRVALVGVRVVRGAFRRVALWVEGIIQSVAVVVDAVETVFFIVGKAIRVQEIGEAVVIVTVNAIAANFNTRRRAVTCLLGTIGLAVTIVVETVAAIFGVAVVLELVELTIAIVVNVSIAADFVP
jgi:hypothetical protein